MKRFFSPHYVLFSARLARKAFFLKKKFKNKSPLSAIKELDHCKSRSYNYTKINQYLALSYFDYQTCINYYQSTSNHITVEIIKALVYYNTTDRVDHFFIEMVDNILDQYASIDSLYCAFNFSLKDKQYTFKETFLSGIVQGKAISLLVRAYIVTKDEKYKTLAQKSIEACKIPIAENGAFRKVNGLSWVEEYPDLEKPSMVLNGHLFLLVGLIDYSTFVSDETYDRFLADLLDSTLMYLPHYRYGDDLLYELGRWKFCNVHYLGIMVPLFEHLYKLTNIEIFQEFQQITNKSCNWKLFNWLLEHR